MLDPHVGDSVIYKGRKATVTEVNEGFYEIAYTDGLTDYAFAKELVLASNEITVGSSVIFNNIVYEVESIINTTACIKAGRRSIYTPISTLKSIDSVEEDDCFFGRGNNTTNITSTFSNNKKAILQTNIVLDDEDI